MANILGFFTVPDWILILIGILTAIHLYYKRKFSFWSSRGVKQMKPIPLFGNMLQMLLKPLFQVDLESYQKMGRLYGMYEGTRPILVIGEPELVKNVLLKDFNIFPGRRLFDEPGNEPLFDDMVSVLSGERWKTMRAVVSQTFTSGKMRKMAPLVNECTESFKECLREAAEKNQTVDIKLLLGAFTMDVIARCAFGIKIDTHKDPNNPFVKNAESVFGQELSVKFLIGALLSPKILHLLRIPLLDREVVKFFRDITRRLIKERNREKNEERNDFLQLILKSSDLKNQSDKEEEESVSAMEGSFELTGFEETSSKFLEIAGLKKKALTENEVLAQCLLFFAAGYETTATTLSYAFYHLALENKIQEKLQKAVDKIYEEHDDITYDTLVKMPYLDAFVSEVLRMDNVGVRLERIAEEDYLLGDTGILLPKGTVVVIPTYAMHHDPELFPDPETFDPERFMPGNKDKIVPYSYLPFGGGPRNCVALRFALMEAKLCLAKVVRHFTFSRCPETKVPPKFLPGSQLLQPVEIVVKVEHRS